MLKSVELLGYFVSADVWCKMVLEHVRTSQSAASLSVLAAVIRGSELSQLQGPHLDNITAAIIDPNISHIAQVFTRPSVTLVNLFSKRISVLL